MNRYDIILNILDELGAENTTQSDNTGLATDIENGYDNNFHTYNGKTYNYKEIRRMANNKMEESEVK